ncbi:hypothetical protein O181_060833 [Austropuccinia psidii MF-1]|uniref:SEC7 domain-containing protein n=1 Tax=Austropuccinia psidii MF-1 TaxID=1389203 RepID=A0A9Q3EH38_9BASI|nr:hypothetical protein [Austropuccinia psidii MF-1]
MTSKFDENSKTSIANDQSATMASAINPTHSINPSSSPKSISSSLNLQNQNNSSKSYHQFLNFKINKSISKVDLALDSSNNHHHHHPADSHQHPSHSNQQSHHDAHSFNSNPNSNSNSNLNPLAHHEINFSNKQSSSSSSSDSSFHSKFKTGHLHQTSNSSNTPKSSSDHSILSSNSHLAFSGPLTSTSIPLSDSMSSFFSATSDLPDWAQSNSFFTNSFEPTAFSKSSHSISNLSNDLKQAKSNSLDSIPSSPTHHPSLVNPNRINKSSRQILDQPPDNFLKSLSQSIHHPNPSQTSCSLSSTPLVFSSSAPIQNSSNNLTTKSLLNSSLNPSQSKSNLPLLSSSSYINLNSSLDSSQKIKHHLNSNSGGASKPSFDLNDLPIDISNLLNHHNQDQTNSSFSSKTNTILPQSTPTTNTPLSNPSTSSIPSNPSNFSSNSSPHPSFLPSPFPSSLLRISQSPILHSNQSNHSDSIEKSSIKPTLKNPFKIDNLDSFNSQSNSIHPKGSNIGLGLNLINSSNKFNHEKLKPKKLNHHDSKEFIHHPSNNQIIRSTRNHQSSPNLIGKRSTSNSEQSLFSLVISHPSNPQFSKSTCQSHHLNLSQYSPSHPQSSTSSHGKSLDKFDSLDLFNHSNDLIDSSNLSLEENAQRLAELLWNKDQSVIKREKMTQWLGSPDSKENQLQVLTLKTYLNKFDFKDLRIDLAFRKLCTKLYLKGETQQVDRILVEFSQRYWNQNQSDLYINSDVVHALSYSILLLNTDLHIVDTTLKMSRSQFIRNTMDAVYAQLSSDLSDLTLTHPIKSLESIDRLGSYKPISDIMPQVRKSGSNGLITNRYRRSSIIDTNRMTSPTFIPTKIITSRPSVDRWKETFRPGHFSRQSQSNTSSHSEPDRTESVSLDEGSSILGSQLNTYSDLDLNYILQSYKNSNSNHPNLSPTSTTPQSTINLNKLTKSFKIKFEKELENLLKDIYLAIKSQPIFQSSSESNSLSTLNYATTPSHLSTRRGQNSIGNLDWGTSYKRASLRGLLSPASELSAPRNKSPTPSGSTSLSISSVPSGPFGPSSNCGSSQTLSTLTSPSVGFVSNLSQSIIREQEEVVDTHSSDETTIREQELALLGAPWAKEGILQRKQYWESKRKRHKDKSWAEVFVVIQKGSLKMFQFGQNTTNIGPSSWSLVSSNSDDLVKDNEKSNGKSGIGGGNWLPNAQLVGEMNLSHALSSVLVSGYSKDRPYVFVLTLSNGASYFYQAGTEELVNEWVSTCNYWAARLSKEPLIGGVSNMEYGWNQLLQRNPLGLSTRNADNKEELDDNQFDPDEIVSVVSGNSNQNHKGRRLRDMLFSTTSIQNNPIDPIAPLHLYRRSTGENDVKSILGNPRRQRSNSGRQLSSPISSAQVSSDRSIICDWNPPNPPITISNLSEKAQLENLKRYAAYLQEELEKHKQLRRPMVHLYFGKLMSLQKAMVNWEKKLQYLMAEIIKYTTYLNSLESTIKLKQEILPPLTPTSATMKSKNSSQDQKNKAYELN